MACNKHKKREGGKVVPVFRGLAVQVNAMLQRMSNIEAVKCGTVRKYQGNPKVRIEPWYRHVSEGRAVLSVCDREYGECEMIIVTRKPGPILRILQQTLKKEHIPVCVLYQAGTRQAREQARAA